jgi:hypothetical protein
MRPLFLGFAGCHSRSRPLEYPAGLYQTAPTNFAPVYAIR